MIVVVSSNVNSQNYKASARIFIFQPKSALSILAIKLSVTSMNGGTLYSLKTVSQAPKKHRSPVWVFCVT